LTHPQVEPVHVEFLDEQRAVTRFSLSDMETLTVSGPGLGPISHFCQIMGNEDADIVLVR